MGSGGSTAAGAAEGAANGAARGGGGTGVVMPSDSSEESECWENVGEEVTLAERGPDPAEDCSENVEQVALAEEEAVQACCLVVPCPPFQSTNTAQRKPAGFLAGTAALANQFDGVECPAQLLDEVGRGEGRRSTVSR